MQINDLRTEFKSLFRRKTTACALKFTLWRVYYKRGCGSQNGGQDLTVTTLQTRLYDKSKSDLNIPTCYQSTSNIAGQRVSLSTPLTNYQTA